MESVGVMVQLGITSRIWALCCRDRRFLVALAPRAHHSSVVRRLTLPLPKGSGSVVYSATTFLPSGGFAIKGAILHTMTFIQTLLQTIWASILALGWIKVITIVIIIALLGQAQRLLGFLAALLFIAFLAHWI